MTTPRASNESPKVTTPNGVAGLSITKGYCCAWCMACQACRTVWSDVVCVDPFILLSLSLLKKNYKRERKREGRRCTGQFARMAPDHTTLQAIQPYRPYIHPIGCLTSISLLWYHSLNDGV